LAGGWQRSFEGVYLGQPGGLEFQGLQGMRTLGHPYSSTLKHHWAQSTCPRSANKPALPIRSASGEATGVVPRPLPDQATQQLADLVARCPQIIDMIGAERQREKRANPQRRAVLAGNTHVLGQKRLNAVSTKPDPVHIGEQSLRSASSRLLQPFLQGTTRVHGQRCAPFFPPFTDAPNVGAGAEMDGVLVEVDQLGKPQSCLGCEQQQGMIPS